MMRQLRSLFGLIRGRLRPAGDDAGLRDRERTKFRQLGWDFDAAIAHLDATLPRIGHSGNYNPAGNSVHWAAAAAIALTDRDAVRRILEIGTYNGFFTRLLAELFPQATVVTADLPDNDPVLEALFEGASDPRYAKLVAKRAANLDHPSITFHQINSFFLPAVVQPGFDLIWVDAGHAYPEVAWDVCNAYHLARLGAYLLTDDVLPDAEVGVTGLVTKATADMIEFLDRRGATSTVLLAKRHDAAAYADPRSRKFVSVSRVNKPAQSPR